MTDFTRMTFFFITHITLIAMSGDFFFHENVNREIFKAILMSSLLFVTVSICMLLKLIGTSYCMK